MSYKITRSRSWQKFFWLHNTALTYLFLIHCKDFLSVSGMLEDAFCMVRLTSLFSWELTAIYFSSMNDLFRPSFMSRCSVFGFFNAATRHMLDWSPPSPPPSQTKVISACTAGSRNCVRPHLYLVFTVSSPPPPPQPPKLTWAEISVCLPPTSPLLC